MKKILKVLALFGVCFSLSSCDSLFPTINPPVNSSSQQENTSSSQEENTSSNQEENTSPFSTEPETTPEETTPEETTPEETTPAVTEPDFSNTPDPDGTKRY